MKTFAIGDIHGGHKALLQCLERAKFDYEADQLISLGDVCDGWPDVKECVDELLKIKNLIFIIGNHDWWALTWMLSGDEQPIWTSQGGRATLKSYGDDPEEVPASHLEFFKNAAPSYLDAKNRLFAHGGIDPNQKDIKKQDRDLLMWDRSLVATAKKKHFIRPDYKFGDFDEIFVGHTSTTYSARPLGTLPAHFCNVWMLDTGGGWEGKLTIMDVDTHEYWQSDLVWALYPDTTRAKRLIRS